jgi:predicted short-subunit dehydrogenase-like oxidoreductase (DUF2520 family)
MTERVLVVGDGRVARALGGALSAAGAAPLSWSRRAGASIPEADLVVIAVHDRAIEEVATLVMRSMSAGEAPILLHCAGALGPFDPFSKLARRPRGCGLLHPLRSLAGEPGDVRLGGTVFGVAGDVEGLAAAERLVAAVGGRPLRLLAEQLPLYHAAAALVANHSLALMDSAVTLLVSLGLSQAQATTALGALLASVAGNLAGGDVAAALTGPIARGEVAVVERHLAALRSHPTAEALYRATAPRLERLAEQKGEAPAEALERLRRLLG